MKHVSAAERLKLRRSTSESKVDKDRKNENERALKSRSVHFDGQISDVHQGTTNHMKQISVIGKDVEKDGENKPPCKLLVTNFDATEEIDLQPPPPFPEKRSKVIVAQRPNSFLWNLKGNIKVKVEIKS